MLATIVQVALGGAIGASLRYLTGVASIRAFGPGFPWATVIVNVAGSAAMGALVVILAHKGGMRFAPFLVTGILGGFTTFSAFSLDAITLWNRDPGLAVLYALGSVVFSILGILAGLALARMALA